MIIQAAADNPDKQIKLLWYSFNLLSDGAMTQIHNCVFLVVIWFYKFYAYSRNVSVCFFFLFYLYFSFTLWSQFRKMTDDFEWCIQQWLKRMHRHMDHRLSRKSLNLYKKKEKNKERRFITFSRHVHVF